jgi:hypothetical protein
VKKKNGRERERGGERRKLYADDASVGKDVSKESEITARWNELHMRSERARGTQEQE